jgi:type I restriction enzyme, S subunit
MSSTGIQHEGWQEVAISEIADVIGGGTPRTTISEYWNGDIPWLTPRDLTSYSRLYISHGERNITEVGLQNSSARIMPKGTVLLTSRAPIGYLAIAANEISTNQGFKSLIINQEKAFNIFIYYWLKSNIDYLKRIGSGSTFAEISGSVVKGVKINLPPLPEQKAIAEVLRSLDYKIDLLHRQNKTLEKMAQSLFRKWFVEEPNEEWEGKPLDEIADYLNGLACQKYPPKDGVEKLPVLKIRELNSGITVNSDWASIEVKEKYIVTLGDVIFSWSGSLVLKIWDGQNCILNQHLFKVTSEKYPKWFYYFWTKHHLEKFIAIAEAKATTMGHIKRGDLASSMVLVPPNKELEEMTGIMAPNLDKIIYNLNQINTLGNLRDTLLPKLMSGEIRLKEFSS